MPLDLKTIIIIIAAIIFFVLSVNLVLFGLMRGDRGVKEEAGKWGLAISGARQAQASQAAQVAALHAAVEALKQAPPTETPAHE
ncbi:MAG: hypothetical protein IT317_06520 [Anaerolineales bacterium]|nr:hypothetical protein [Anaerolineales bacterium]